MTKCIILYEAASVHKILNVLQVNYKLTRNESVTYKEPV